MFPHFALRSLTLCLCLLPLLATAQQRVQYFHVQSGTGFFVNRDTIVTNEHVVRGCAQVLIKGAVPEQRADVIVMDAQRDLALIRSPVEPKQFAPLRIDIDSMRAGDKVIILGYPGEAGARGEFKMAEAEMQDLSLNGLGKPGQFYITDVVEHGNSGGPVFDVSGNVIGVVVAKNVLTTSNASTHEIISQQHVGVAISLSTLKDFLLNHGVFTQWSSSSLMYTDSYISENAHDYIVNVQCRTVVE